jgi:hypothetical protein
MTVGSRGLAIDDRFSSDITAEFSVFDFAVVPEDLWTTGPWRLGAACVVDCREGNGSLPFNTVLAPLGVAPSDFAAFVSAFVFDEACRVCVAYCVLHLDRFQIMPRLYRLRQTMVSIVDRDQNVDWGSLVLNRQR